MENTPEEFISLSLSEIPEEEFIPLPLKSLEEIKKEIIKKIYAYAKLLVDGLTEEYPKPEISTWTKKETEATNYLDTGEVAPHLKKEALGRYPKDKYPGLSESEAIATLSVKVVEKADFYYDRLLKITSARGYHSDSIGEKLTIEEVMNYDWWSERWS